MSSRQGQTIQWSSYNYPSIIITGSGSAAESVGFDYGSNRERWEQEYQGNLMSEATFYAAGLMDMVVVNGLTTDYRNYIYAGSEPVATYSRNSNGVNTVNYVLGLTHMNGRVLDSITGRFLSADPTVPHSESAQSWNRYSYVENNPMSSVDPSGFTDILLMRDGGGGGDAFGGWGGLVTVTVPGTLDSEYAQMEHELAWSSFANSITSAPPDFGRDPIAEVTVLGHKSSKPTTPSPPNVQIPYIPNGLLDLGAGAYAVTAAAFGPKPFSSLTGPMFSDASAAAVRNSALSSNGCSP
jgi:RHS repeat-associated protein